MPGGGGEKTEPATQKRRNDERKKGNVFMSREVGPLVCLLAVIYTIRLLGETILSALLKSFHMFWGDAGSVKNLDFSMIRPLFLEAAGAFAVAAVPALLVAIVVSVLITVFQTKGLFAMEALKPKFSKLNPLSGIKKMFSLRSIIELLKSILKIIVLAYVIYNQYIERFYELPRLMEMDLVHVIGYIGAFVLDIINNVAIIYAVIVAGDYLYQRWQYEKDLRMSKQEIKEEYKQTEGDPQIKGAIKRRQREMAQSRMMQEVPEADVVIRNPTHYAVALRYVAKKNTAPEVVAKGADLVALRIIKLAEENDVVVTENRPLARSLYETVPLGAEVPAEFYQTVAEVLAFVYAAKDKKAPSVAGAKTGAK